MKLTSISQLNRKCATLLFPVLLAACTDELSLYPDGNTGVRPHIRISASIDQECLTRADESGFADGDRFGVYVVNYAGETPGTLSQTENQVNNVAFSYDADKNVWTSATDVYWRDNETPADIYGYYPFDNGLGDVEYYRFEVESNQSEVGESGMSNYEASDFLWAKTVRALPGRKVDLSFRHVMAGVKVTLEKGSGFEGDSWSELQKTVTVDNTLRSSEINLSTGVVTPVGSFDRNIAMNPEADDSYRAVVVPQTVAAGKSTIGVTIDGTTYRYNRSDGMTYTGGKLHNFTIKIDRKTDGGAYALTLVSEDITDWIADQSSHDFVENSYLCISCPEAGKLRESLHSVGIDLNSIRNLKISGLLTTDDFDFIRNDLLSLTCVNLYDVQIVNVAFRKWNEYDGVIEDVKEDNIIPDYALREKSSLRRIILPQTIQKVGKYAFQNLSLNSTVTIPESVTHIDDGAFYGIREGAEIIMPHNLVYIGDDAFYECKASVEVILNNAIRYIGHSAFWGATNAFGSFTLPNNLQFMGENSLALGSNFDGEIVIPASLSEIPNFVFFRLNLKGGTKVTFHDGITKIGSGAFAGISFSEGFKLPSSIVEIGDEAFDGCHFAEELALPPNIQKIGTRAFCETNLKGSLTIPASVEMLSPTPLADCGQSVGSFAYCMLENVKISEGVEIIGGRAFYGNSLLRTVEIGKTVGRIGMEAFANCPGLQRVVCLAKEPPKLYNDVFVGFDPLHCRLEVPEESVELYKRADGWKEFQFISAHRELAFGFHKQSCLNKGISRSAILYAEGKWKVRECPSWIRVTPDHGDYKDEVSVSVLPLAKGAGNRAGKIVFELEGKDYTTECEINQYDYEHPEDTEIKLQSASAVSTPVNVLFIGDGFGAEEIINGRYMGLMNEVAEHFFSIEPYKSYRNYFDVSTSIVVSADNAVSTPQTHKLCRLNTTGTELDLNIVRDYACNVSGCINASNIKDALIVVVSNLDAFSGNSYIDSDGCSLACVSVSKDEYPYDLRGLIQHYAGGRAFAGLAPENVSHNEHIKGCTCPYCNSLPEYYAMKEKGLFENITISGKMNDAPWKDFIFHPKYSYMVDMWEGGLRHLLGVWRSESQSVMGTYIPYFNTISRYAIYKAIMRRTGRQPSLDDFIKNDKIETLQ